MYEQYWGLTCSPFPTGIGEGWFYESPTHEEGLARLDFLLEQRRRCGVLTGEKGTGKSSLLAILSRQLRRSQRQAAVIDACGLSGDQLLCQLVDALHLSPIDTNRPYLQWRSVRDHLHGLARSRQQTVLMFDHFNHRDTDCTRTIEQLLHLGDAGDRWHTVIVAVDTSTPAPLTASFFQLADLRIHLTPFDQRETSYYVYQSLTEAGAERELFEPAALEAVFGLSAGVPRRINQICELSLLAGMFDEQRTIDAETVISAAEHLPLGEILDRVAE